jgi:dipeptidase E
MKLALYSGGGSRENRGLVREALTLLEGRRNPVFAFVPADSEDAERDYLVFRRKFQGSRLRRFRCIPVDRPLSAREEKTLFSADAIFLGGGNTFYFLKQIRERRLLAKFRSFVKRGGVLMGLSAGGILMTPNIMTASVPSMDSDENEVGLKDLKALGLVPFEFSPHYHPSRSVDRELLAYSRRLPHPVYACADGQGVIVKSGSVQFVGRVSVFHQGRKFLVT